MAIGAWLESLVKGSVPDSLQRFLTSWCRLTGNIEAYAMLLVPTWPGIPMDATGSEQVTFEIDHADLRRAAAQSGSRGVPAEGHCGRQSDRERRDQPRGALHGISCATDRSRAAPTRPRSPPLGRVRNIGAQ